mgnify:CR=1 FL=1
MFHFSFFAPFLIAMNFITSILYIEVSYFPTRSFIIACWCYFPPLLILFFLILFGASFVFSPFSIVVRLFFFGKWEILNSKVFTYNPSHLTTELNLSLAVRRCESWFVLLFFPSSYYYCVLAIIACKSFFSLKFSNL